jgi:hypothetical protein
MDGEIAGPRLPDERRQARREARDRLRRFRTPRRLLEVGADARQQIPIDLEEKVVGARFALQVEPFVVADLAVDLGVGLVAD